MGNALARIATRRQVQAENVKVNQYNRMHKLTGSISAPSNTINVRPLNNANAWGSWTAVTAALSPGGLIVRLQYNGEQDPKDVAQTLRALQTRQATKKTGQKLNRLSVNTRGSALSVTVPRGANVKLPARLIAKMLTVDTNLIKSQQDVINWYKADRVKMGDTRSVNQIINVLRKREALENDDKFLKWKQQAPVILKGLRNVSKTFNHGNTTLESVLKENMAEYIKLEGRTYTKKGSVKLLDESILPPQGKSCYVFTFHSKNKPRNSGNSDDVTYYDSWVETLSEQEGFDNRLNQVESNIDRLLTALVDRNQSGNLPDVPAAAKAKQLYTACLNASLNDHPLFRECAGFPVISTKSGNVMDYFRDLVYHKVSLGKMGTWVAKKVSPQEARTYHLNDDFRRSKGNVYVAWPTRSEVDAYHTRHPL